MHPEVQDNKFQVFVTTVVMCFSVICTHGLLTLAATAVFVAVNFGYITSR